MTIEDTLLVRRLMNREEEAFDAIFKDHYQDLLSFSARFLWDLDAAEDIVQDVFLKLFEAGDKLSIRVSIRAYLFRSVRNRCLNYLRDRKVLDTHSQCFIETTIWTDSISFLNDVDLYDDPATLDLLNEVIEKLPQRSQDIVIMRLRKEYKFSEIAKILNITQNNAKVLMSRAVSIMRKEFAKHVRFRNVGKFE